MRSKLKTGEPNPYRKFTRGELDRALEYARDRVESGEVSEWGVKVLKRNIKKMERFL